MLAIALISLVVGSAALGDSSGIPKTQRIREPNLPSTARQANTTATPATPATPTENTPGTTVDNSGNNTVVAVTVTATLAPRPRSQPAKKVLLVLSFFVQDTNVTQELSDSIIGCLANTSNTPTSDWGLYNTSFLGGATTQVEYFAFADMYESVFFRGAISAFVANKSLPGCVRARDSAFPTSAKIIAGRKSTELMPNDVKEVVGGIPVWVVGAVVGALLLITIIGVIVATVKKTRIFDKIIFDEDYEEVSTVDEAAREAAREEADLRAITRKWI